MSVRLWLAGGWFLICVLIGCKIYRQQWNKVRDYKNWVSFCGHLHQAIGFALLPLPQVIADYLPVCRGECRRVLANYLGLLKENVDLTRERCQSLCDDPVLTEFFYQMGRTGRETEQDKIIALRTVLQEKQEQAQRDLQSKASIMLKLLIIIGIAGGILWM